MAEILSETEESQLKYVSMDIAFCEQLEPLDKVSVPSGGMLLQQQRPPLQEPMGDLNDGFLHQRTVQFLQPLYLPKQLLKKSEVLVVQL